MLFLGQLFIRGFGIDKCAVLFGMDHHARHVSREQVISLFSKLPAYTQDYTCINKKTPGTRVVHHPPIPYLRMTDTMTDRMIRRKSLDILRRIIILTDIRELRWR